MSAWLEGHTAAVKDSEKGVYESKCPYPEGSHEYNEWMDGYSTGMDDWYYCRYV